VPLTGMMAIVSHTVGGALLIAAGLYQITALKRACLAKCQTPLFYLAHHWRNARSGAFRMGVSHGMFCLGCCWVLMLLLFYGGVMDFRWIIGLAIYVAAEKLVPMRYRIHGVAAAVLVLWGIVVLMQTWMQ
jgi:predicted metal-binding membrane protein